MVEGRASRAAIDTATEYTTKYDWSSYSTDVEMLRRAGDLTGDGIDDMMAFLEYESGGFGVNELFSSERQGTAYEEPNDCAGDISGTNDGTNGNVGYGMAPIGRDIDGDGREDFAVGDPDQDSYAGQAYVLINEML